MKDIELDLLAPHHEFPLDTELSMELTESLINTSRAGSGQGLMFSSCYNVQVCLAVSQLTGNLHQHQLYFAAKFPASPSISRRERGEAALHQQQPATIIQDRLFPPGGAPGLLPGRQQTSRPRLLPGGQHAERGRGPGLSGCPQSLLFF